MNSIRAGSCHWKCFAQLLVAMGWVRKRELKAEKAAGKYLLPHPGPPWRSVMLYSCHLRCAVALLQWVLVVGTKHAQCGRGMAVAEVILHGTEDLFSLVG